MARRALVACETCERAYNARIVDEERVVIATANGSCKCGETEFTELLANDTVTGWSTSS